MAKTTFSDTPPQGTIVTAAFLNAVNNHRHGGRANDGEGTLDYAVDSGAANAYVVTLSPVLDAFINGMPIFFKAANSNTGASTINVNSLGAVALRKNGTEALISGDILAGQIVVCVYDGTYFQLIGLPSTQTGDIQFSMSPTPKAGEIKINGAELSRTTYARLWAWAQANSVVVNEVSWSPGNTGAFSRGDGSTTFRIPDFRGEFPRIFDEGRGVDSGRVFGTSQSDALKSHSHNTGYYAANIPGYPNTGMIGSGDESAPITALAAGGTETRPRNITLYAFIKF